MDAQDSPERSEIKVNFATLVLFLIIAVPVLYLGIQGKLSRNGVARVAGDKVTALAELINAANVDPNFDNFFRLAFAYQQKRMFKEAVDAYKKAVSINPHSPVAFNNLGVAYSELGMFEEQIEATKKALDLDPTYERAQNNLIWATGQLRAKTASEKDGSKKN
jgi:tetratricopeptide (TPR) repeat protein